VKLQKMGLRFMLGMPVAFLMTFGMIGIGCASSGGKTKEYTNTEKARMLVEIANGSLVEGDPTGALQNIFKAERFDSSLPELYHTKALALFAKRDLISAVEAARKAVKMQPNFSDASNTLGKLLLDLGKYDEAVGPLTRAANDPLYRETYKSWTNLGILKYKTGEYIQSEVFLNRAIQESPSNACVAYFFRGQIKDKDFRLDEAIADYGEATKRQCSRFGDAKLALGMSYQKSKQYEEARKTFLEIQKLYPNTKLAENAIHQLRNLP